MSCNRLSHIGIVVLSSNSNETFYGEMVLYVSVSLGEASCFEVDREPFSN